MAISACSYSQVHSEDDVLGLLTSMPDETPFEHVVTTSKTVTVSCVGLVRAERIGNELLYQRIQHRWFGGKDLVYCIITLGEPYSDEDMARLERGLKPLAESN